MESSEYNLADTLISSPRNRLHRIIQIIHLEDVSIQRNISLNFELLRINSDFIVVTASHTNTAFPETHVGPQP